LEANDPTSEINMRGCILTILLLLVTSGGAPHRPHTAIREPSLRHEDCLLISYTNRQTPQIREVIDFLKMHMEQPDTARGIEILRFNKRTGGFIFRSATVDYAPQGKIMIWYILLAVVAVIGIVALIASTKPDEWTIHRQGAVPGTPAKVFPYMDDLHKFLEWSPWAKLDPTMKWTCGGPSSGSGANFSWEGNGKVGVGKMTITESRPNDLVRCQFDFYKTVQLHQHPRVRVEARRFPNHRDLDHERQGAVFFQAFHGLCQLRHHDGKKP
jgi:hypothetical protein